MDNKEKDIIYVEKVPKQMKKEKNKIITKVIPQATINYKVVVDIDKDLDLLLCCGLLNRRGINSILEYGDRITCGLYSSKSSALIIKGKIEDLGFRAIIVEV